MVWGIEADIILYGVCLGLSLILVLVSAFSGGDFDADLDFDIDLPDDAPGVHIGSAGLPRYNLFNPIALLSFLGGFGAIGFIAKGAGSSTVVGLAIAIAGGLAVSWLVFRVFVRFVLKGQGSSSHHLDALVGKIAVVNVSIPVTGMGTIAYEINGQRHTLAARTTSPDPLPRGAEVVIVELDRNVATVIQLGTRN